MSTKEQNLLDSAKSLASSNPTWADLSNELYDQSTGLLAKAYTTREERQRFVRSPQYKAIRALIAEAQDRTGLIEGATPRGS